MQGVGAQPPNMLPYLTYVGVLVLTHASAAASEKAYLLLLLAKRENRTLRHQVHIQSQSRRNHFGKLEVGSHLFDLGEVDNKKTSSEILPYEISEIGAKCSFSFFPSFPPSFFPSQSSFAMRTSPTRC